MSDNKSEYLENLTKASEDAARHGSRKVDDKDKPMDDDERHLGQVFPHDAKEGQEFAASNLKFILENGPGANKGGNKSR